MRASHISASARSVSDLLQRLYTAKKFTPDHEAVIFDDETNIGTVTITNYAQESLGDVVFVELPAVGTKVAAHGEFPRFTISYFSSLNPVRS